MGKKARLKDHPYLYILIHISYCIISAFTLEYYDYESTYSKFVFRICVPIFHSLIYYY